MSTSTSTSTDTTPRPARLDERRRALAADPKHTGFALAMARRFARHYPSRRLGDFEGAALMGLVKAAKTHDFAGRPSFITHSYQWIMWALLKVREKESCGGLTGRARDRSKVPPSVESFMGGEWRIVDAGADPVGWEAEYHDELRAIAAEIGSRSRVQAARFLAMFGECQPDPGADPASTRSRRDRETRRRKAIVVGLRAFAGRVCG